MSTGLQTSREPPTAFPLSGAMARVAALADMWTALIAASVSVALGLYQLGQPSLWIDEAATYEASSRSYVDLVHEHHWIYYSLMKPWAALAGTSEIALRLPSVAAAAAACALLVPLGNRLLGRPVGSIAGVVLALNPFVVQWSQQARSYTIVMLAAIVTTWLFVRMRSEAATRSWLAYAVCLGVFVLIQPLSAGLVAATHFLAAKGFRVKVVTAGVAVMLVTSVFLIGVAERDSKSGTLVWNVDPTVGSVSRAVLELSGALGVGLALSVVGLAVVRRERLLLASWAFAPLLISIVVTPIGKVFVDRYVIVSTPAFALLVAVVLRELRGTWRAAAVAAFAVGTIAGLLIWYGPDGSQNWRGEDWQAATRFAMQRGGATVYPYWAADAYEYYGGVERKTGLYLLWSENPSDFAGELAARRRLRPATAGAAAVSAAPPSGNVDMSASADVLGEMPSADHVSSSRTREILETSPFPILLVSLVGIVLLTVFAPSIVVGDTWLTLMAGREIVEHGLPHTEEITILGQGATWTDQQWLAQLLFYGAHVVGGVRAVILLDVALVLLALGLAVATARASGGSSRSTFLVGLLAVLAGPWGWTIRAQTAALPLFAGVLWLLVDASRQGVRRRTLLVLPMLVIWANLHGSVVLGAGLTVLLALLVMVRARRLSWIPAALAVLAPLCVLVSPYGTKLVAYYRLMLVDAPFAPILREWQWSSPSGTTALFWGLAIVAGAILALRRCRSRLTFYELAVLLVAFVGAVQAVRGVIWFALACAAILPVALDGLLTRADVDAPRLNRMISIGALAALAVAVIAFVARPGSWFVSDWPEQRVEAVRAATRDPSTRVYATDGTADWLLWRIPDLRGRLAYDVRFELYDQDALDEIVRYGTRSGGWKSLLDGYRVVLVPIVPGNARLNELLAEPHTRVVYRDTGIAVVELPAKR